MTKDLLALVRRQLLRRRQGGPGMVPGTVRSHLDALPPTIRVFAYGPDDYAEQDVRDVAELGGFRQKWPVVWVDVAGLGDADLIRAIGATFAIHPLVLEDAVNTWQRAKVEEYEDNLFLVARMLQWRGRLDNEQLSIVLGRGFVVTFREMAGDCLAAVRERLRKGRGRIRHRGSDYLAYTLLDALVDHYFPVLEALAERLEGLEERALANPSRGLVAELYETRRDLLAIRRVVQPLRDALSMVLREPVVGVEDQTRVFFRDCHDHVVQATDLVETYRELTGSLIDLHLSLVSNRMNEVMRILTIFSAVFIPLSFIAGLYGMNFNSERSPWNMPELSWYYGYPAALGLMLTTAAGLLVFFARRGWLRRADAPGFEVTARRGAPEQSSAALVHGSEHEGAKTQRTSHTP